jgi:hypothetical protein
MSVLTPLRIARALTALLPLIAGGFPPAASAGPDGAARVIGTRMAHRDHYDRVVIEFDREIRFRPVAAPSEQVRIIEVDSLAPHVERLSLTGSVARAGRVREIVFERTARGSRIIARGATSNLQVFGLQAPPRILIDFADSGGPVKLSRPLFPEPATFPSAGGDAALRAGDRQPGQAGVELRIQSPDAGEAAATGDAARLPIPAGLGTALGLIGAAAAALAFGSGRPRGGGTRVVQHDEPASAEVASRAPRAAELRGELQAQPSEPVDRIAMLERRHDEEVRARMALEERVVRLSEDLRALQQHAGRESPRSSARA